MGRARVCGGIIVVGLHQVIQSDVSEARQRGCEQLCTCSDLVSRKRPSGEAMVASYRILAAKTRSARGWVCRVCTDNPTD